MKHTKIIVMAALMGLACVGSVAAHGHKGGWGRGGWGPGYATAVGEAVTVSGTLQLIDGQIVVVSGGTTYITRDIQRLVGFIDGLKEGATVKVEGQASAVPLNANARFLRVSKLTVGGKDYTFPIR